MALSFHTRLMRLCELTYTAPRGPFSLPANAASRFLDVGLIGPAQAIGRNPMYNGVRDLAIVGHLPEGIVIAVRGTQPPRFDSLEDAIAIGEDWANDGLILGTRSDDLGGIVHQGFADSAASLCKDSPDEGVISRVKAMVGGNAASTRIILTGHSKGGPVAQIIAFLLRRDPALAAAQIEVVTFAAARPGDAGFAALFNAGHIPCLRYETHYDIVPRLPSGVAPDAALAGILNSLGIVLQGGTIGFVSLGNVVAETQAEADAWPGPATSFPFNLAAELIQTTPMGEAYRAIAAHGLGPGSHYEHLLDTRSNA